MIANIFITPPPTGVESIIEAPVPLVQCGPDLICDECKFLYWKCWCDVESPKKDKETSEKKEETSEKKGKAPEKKKEDSDEEEDSDVEDEVPESNDTTS